MEPIEQAHRAYLEDIERHFQKEGELICDDLSMLEMFLEYALSQKDTAPIAQALLTSTRNSLSKVFDLPPSTLKALGLSEPACVLFQLVPAFCAKYYAVGRGEQTQEECFDTDEKIRQLLFPYFIGKKEEYVLLLLLDAHARSRYCGFVSRGTSFSSDINLSGILQLSAEYQADFAVLAHNHPSGVALPSQADREATRKLQMALEVMGIQLKEHYIFGEGASCAMSSIEGVADLFIH